MEVQARETAINYLLKQNLSQEGLRAFESKVHPKPDFSYLYTGSGRCIEIIVICDGTQCTDWAAYPYDEHNETCP